MKLTEVDKNIFTIRDFLTKQECDHFIDISERIGYEAATVETEKGSKVVAEVRNNQRVLYKNDKLAAEIGARALPLLPKQIGLSQLLGLNELFRFYKYGTGEKFKKHIDESFIRNEAEASYYTFMIYLNDNFEGGETVFENTSIKSTTGMALIFLHSLPHEGSEVGSGYKYILRTDVMYRLIAE